MSGENFVNPNWTVIASEEVGWVDGLINTLTDTSNLEKLGKLKLEAKNYDLDMGLETFITSRNYLVCKIDARRVIYEGEEAAECGLLLDPAGI